MAATSFRCCPSERIRLPSKPQVSTDPSKREFKDRAPLCRGWPPAGWGVKGGLHAAWQILGTVSVLMTGGTLFRPKANLYLYLPDGTGLDKGSPVRVDGIGVGKVGSVLLSGSSDPNRIVKVTMIVESNRLPSIAEDSTAQTASDTMIGDKFVDISSGTSPNHIQPGAEMQFKGSPELMKTLDMSEFEHQLRLMDAVLTDIEQGRGQVGQFVIGEGP